MCWQRVPDRVSLSLSPRFPPPPHALGSWGVETGAGDYIGGEKNKNVEEKERIQSNFGGFFPPVLWFRQAANRVTVSLVDVFSSSCFRCAEGESRLLPMY